MTNPSLNGASRRLGALLTSPIRWTIASFLAAHRMRRARAELAALDDRLLADVGLNRAEIWSAAEAAQADVGEPANSHVCRRQTAPVICGRVPS